MNAGYRNRGGYSGRGRGKGRQTTGRQRGMFADGVWHCDCTPRLPAEHFKVKKEGPNQGRWFYTCQQRQGSEGGGCGFFLWDDDAKPREEAAVLIGKRSEPQAEDAQEGWNAGRGRQNGQPQGRGMFAGVGESRHDRDASTASPTPPPSYQSGTMKRSAQEANFDDDNEWDLDAGNGAGSNMPSGSNLETPHKAQKTGVYATPATTAKRKLPWLEQPTTPASSSRPTNDYFDTPSKSGPPIKQEPGTETPAAPPTLATAASPSLPTRFRDAMHNPADSSSSLTNEVLTALSSTNDNRERIEKVRSICTKHDLRYQGAIKGRDISRLAMRAKDAKIAELQARIASLEADREVERGLSRMKKYDSGAMQE